MILKDILNAEIKKVQRKRRSARKKAPGSSYKPINPGQIRKWERDYLSGVMSPRQQKNVEKRLRVERDRANRRLKRFTERGKKSRAESRARGKIHSRYGKERTTFGKGSGLDDLFASAYDINAFLADETSTITGAKAYNLRKREEFKKKFPGVADKMTADELDDFLRYLHDESVSDYFDFFKNYEEEIEKMAAIFEEDSDMDWLESQFDAFAEYQKEAKKEGSFTKKGITARELRDSINKRYKDVRRRKRK